MNNGGQMFVVFQVVGYLPTFIVAFLLRGLTTAFDEYGSFWDRRGWRISVQNTLMDAFLLACVFFGLFYLLSVATVTARA
jgi:hypothetical protein